MLTAAPTGIKAALALAARVIAPHAAHCVVWAAGGASLLVLQIAPSDAASYVATGGGLVALGMALQLVIKAVGEHWWPAPQIRARNLEGKVAAQGDELTRLQAELTELKAEIARKEEMVEAERVRAEARLNSERQKAAEERATFVANLSDLTEKNAILTRDNIKLLHLMMVRAKHQQEDVPFRAEDFLIDDKPPPTDGPLVLVVEDIAEAREGTRQILLRSGFRVALAATLREAFQAMEDSEPSCMILDLMLPDGDGIDVLRHVRREGLPIKVVVITAKDQTDPSLDPVRALHPAGLFTKPGRFFQEVLPVLRNNGGVLR